MKARLVIYILLCCFIPHILSALPYECFKKRAGRNAAKTTIAHIAEDDYDVKYLKFNISVSDTSVYVSGNVYSRAVVTADSLPVYVFELDTSLTVDSVFIGGVMLSATALPGSVRAVTLPLSLAHGAIFAATVYYHGLPPGGGGGFFNGITHSISSAGTHMVYTVSDPYVAKNWWPCKQSIQDKIDSVDMYVTVPAHVADGSNGVLVAVDSLTDTARWTYHWKTNYPIDYYLISIAVARYGQYRSYMHFTGSTDSMLIHNFFLDTATFNPTYKSNFDSLEQMINYFSGLYGRYPFWREKYGVCYTSLPGGMEHQTMTTIGTPETYIIAHELGHQWFGDNVTYQDWRDVWLSEGFATFSEQLFLDHFWSAAAARAHRQALLNNALLSACGRVIVTDTTNSDSLFNQRTVYNKAQAVVRMLQYVAPSDSVFFAMLRTYQQSHALGHASTADLKALAETMYGVPLDTFFNQWVYGRGYPIYKMYWNQVGATVYVKLIQTRSCPSYTNHFSTPLQLQLHSATADTFMKVYNSADTQYYSFTWSPTVTNVYLNPDIWTILKQAGTTHDVGLGVGAVPQNKWDVYPNPTDNSWQLQNAQEGVALQLINISGQVLWSGTTTKGTTVIPAKGLPAGDYYLKFEKEPAENSLRLVHW